MDVSMLAQAVPFAPAPAGEVDSGERGEARSGEAGFLPLLGGVIRAGGPVSGGGRGDGPPGRNEPAAGPDPVSLGWASACWFPASPVPGLDGPAVNLPVAAGGEAGPVPEVGAGDPASAAPPPAGAVSTAAAGPHGLLGKPVATVEAGPAVAPASPAPGLERPDVSGSGHPPGGVAAHAPPEEAAGRAPVAPASVEAGAGREPAGPAPEAPAAVAPGAGREPAGRPASAGGFPNGGTPGRAADPRAVDAVPAPGGGAAPEVRSEPRAPARPGAQRPAGEPARGGEVPTGAPEPDRAHPGPVKPPGDEFGAPARREVRAEASREAGGTGRVQVADSRGSGAGPPVSDDHDRLRVPPGIEDPRPAAPREPAAQVGRTATEAGAPRWLDLAVRELVSRARLLGEGERASAVIQLAPRGLGALSLEVSLEDGLVSARFVTPHREVGQLLGHHLGELREALAAGGLSPGDLGVTVGDHAALAGQGQAWGQTGPAPAAGGPVVRASNAGALAAADLTGPITRLDQRRLDLVA